MDKDKKAKLLTLRQQINSALKTTALQMINEDDDLTIKRCSSGIRSLDKILGRGSNGWGFPVGRIIEIYGPEAGGKTSVVLSAIAACQKAGGSAAIIDAEHALNLEYAEKMGVDFDALLVCNPSSAEEAFDTVEALANSGIIDLIVVDSIAALTPLHVAETSYENKHMDGGAKLNSQFMRRVNGILSKNNCTLILINQIREKIGVMFGNPETTPGGRAIKFYASTRIEVRRGEVLKKDGVDFGHVVKCKTVKNKTASPNQVAEFRIVWGEGFDAASSLIEQGLKLGIIRKSGAWLYLFEDEIKFQGNESLMSALRENKELFDRLELQVSAHDG